jgi:hypothetical protein
MRRELSLVGASLVVYACALVLGTLVICGTGHASEVVGEWATQGNAAHVRIERCSTALELLCGLVTWLWEPIDAEGDPLCGTPPKPYGLNASIETLLTPNFLLAPRALSEMN